MKFVNILPTEFIDKPWCWCSDIHLPLAHLIEDGNEYTEKFKKLETIKILDNGYFEKLENPKLDELIDKAKLINANALILPDTFCDSPIFEKIIKDMCSTIPENLKIYAIPLAADYEDSQFAFKILNRLDEVDVISIPDRMLSKYTCLPRINYLDWVDHMVRYREWKTKPIHLLALDNYQQLSKLAEYNFVESIDSTAPFKLGYTLRYMRTNDKDYFRPTNYFEIKDLSIDQIMCIRDNVAWVKEVCK